MAQLFFYCVIVDFLCIGKEKRKCHALCQLTDDPQIYSLFPTLTLYYLPSTFLPPDVDECKNNPCKNGGTCTNSKGSYKCNCVQGFTGKHCNQGKKTVALMDNC